MESAEFEGEQRVDTFPAARPRASSMGRHDERLLHFTLA